MVSRTLYRFSPEVGSFAGRTPVEKVALLRSWSGDAAFEGYADPAFVEAAHAAELQVYFELPRCLQEQLHSRFRRHLAGWATCPAGFLHKRVDRYRGQ